MKSKLRKLMRPLDQRYDPPTGRSRVRWYHRGGLDEGVSHLFPTLNPLPKLAFNGVEHRDLS